MKNISIVLLCLLTISFFSCRKSRFDSEWTWIEHDGEKRHYLLHVPDSYDGIQPVSLILALHGGAGTPKKMENGTEFSLLSDQEGFIVCYPEGLNRSWNAGSCCGKAKESEQDHDDVGFLTKLIDKLLLEYNIDPNRVFVTGMSNGGFMAYRLACEIPEKIAAIAPVAASMTVDVCEPAAAVSILHIHSVLDKNIPFAGGVGEGFSDHYNPPVDSVLDVWGNKNGCVILDSLIYSVEYDCRLWSTCTDSTEIHLYLTLDGGHSWPGTGRTKPEGYESSSAFDGKYVIWEFFKLHPRR